MDDLEEKRRRSSTRGSSTLQAKKKFDEDQKKKKNQLEMQLESEKEDREALSRKASAARDDRDSKEESWKQIKKAFRISDNDLNVIKRKGLVRSIVNLLYLVVIVGCELDLYGFMMAYSTYWFMGYILVNILLVLAPVGYLLAILMYMYLEEDLDSSLLDRYLDRYREDDSEKDQKSRDKDDQKSRDKDDSEKDDFCEDLPGLAGPRTPIELRFYHFLPIFRYFLVIKDKTKADVEGLFRVNSLSSFTLGIAQIISILFQVVIAGKPFTLFVIINIGSQIINWLITIIYFTTPASEIMSSSIKVSARAANSRDQLRKIHEKYYADFRNKKRTEEITKWVDKEISTRGGRPDEDISKYPMDLKLKALQLLRLKESNFYAEI